MQAWIRDGMKGPPPSSQTQLQQQQQAVVQAAANVAVQGAKVIPQPVVRTGSILKATGQ